MSSGRGPEASKTLYRGAATEALQCIQAPRTMRFYPPRATTAPTHMVSPNTLYLGSLVPMSPVTAGPVCMPTRIRVGSPLCGMRTVLAHRRMACACDCVRECVCVCVHVCVCLCA